MSEMVGSPFCHSCGTDPGWEQKIIQSNGKGICSMCVEIYQEAKERESGKIIGAGCPESTFCDYCGQGFSIREKDIHYSNGLAICATCNQLCFEIFQGQRPCPPNWKATVNNPGE